MTKERQLRRATEDPSLPHPEKLRGNCESAGAASEEDMVTDRPRWLEGLPRHL